VSRAVGVREDVFFYFILFFEGSMRVGLVLAGGRRTELPNDVSLDGGSKMHYGVIQRLDEGVQLAGWLSHYFPIYIYRVRLFCN
jgi:hypothetical protein